MVLVGSPLFWAQQSPPMSSGRSSVPSPTLASRNTEGSMFASRKPRFGLVPLLSPPFCCLSLRATSLSQENTALLAAGEEESALADIEHPFALEDIAGDLDGVFEESSCSPSPASRCCMPSPLPSAVTTRRAFMMAQHVAINTLPSTLFLPCTLCHEHMGRNIHTHTVALDVAAHLQHHAAACPPLCPLRSLLGVPS